MKKLAIILITLLLTTIAYGDWTTTWLGTQDNSIVGTIGKVFDGGRSEAGFHTIISDRVDENYNVAIGLYGATEFDIPIIKNYLNSDELKTFAGFAESIDTREWRPIHTPFVGGILNPDKQFSPVVVLRYNFLDGGIDQGDRDPVAKNPLIDPGLNVFFGMRILIK